QKGLRDWQAPALEAALARWAERLRLDLGRDVAARPGAGAGGGLPAGLLAAVPDARIESGAALVDEAIGLAPAIEGVELVVTGEGALDAQTAYGKAVAHVAATAKARSVPCLAVAGVVDGLPPGVLDAAALSEGDVSVEEAMANATVLAEAAAERLVRRWVQ